MPTPSSAPARVLLLLLLSCQFAASGLGASPSWQERHDQLVARLRALTKMEDAFGPAYQPLYHAALPWYELWGGRTQHAVDDWMVPPADYAAELADALEHGRNYIAENPAALLPLVFEVKLPNGSTTSTNYWLSLPTGFPESGRKYPLVVGLHGSGWLGHPLSFVRQSRGSVAVRRTFGVTPINEAGSWQIEFLNAYLDRLLQILPVDRDHIYVEGHSLGGMATWEWALNNPERFAAISPRAGIGEPYRASRLKNVPAWVIHGSNDDVVSTGYADQMVIALESCGASVRYSVLPGVPHNMPEDLDQEQVVDWYLRQTRNPAPPPADPRDALGLTSAGFSLWDVVASPGGRFWPTDLQGRMSHEAVRSTEQTLFKKAHDLGLQVDAPVLQQHNLKTHAVRFWLAAPKTLHADPRINSTTVALPAARYVRFYFRGPTQHALEHLATVMAEATAAGHRLRAETVWITPLSLWRESPTAIAECRVETE